MGTSRLRPMSYEKRDQVGGIFTCLCLTRPLLHLIGRQTVHNCPKIELAFAHEAHRAQTPTAALQNLIELEPRESQMGMSRKAGFEPTFLGSHCTSSGCGGGAVRVFSALCMKVFHAASLLELRPCLPDIGPAGLSQYLYI